MNLLYFRWKCTQLFHSKNSLPENYVFTQADFLQCITVHKIDLCDRRTDGQRSLKDASRYTVPGPSRASVKTRPNIVKCSLHIYIHARPSTIRASPELVRAPSQKCRRTFFSRIRSVPATLRKAWMYFSRCPDCNLQSWYKQSTLFIMSVVSISESYSSIWRQA